MLPWPDRDHTAPEAERVAQRYQILQEIARGGMGVVFRVIDVVSGEERALKRMLPVDPRHRNAHRAAFEREFQVLAMLDHPRIMRVFEYGLDEHGPYYIMELVRGEDLKSQGARPWREVCSLARDLSSALSLLHARRLVYRDLNPGNVKVTSPGHCKLLDFGALASFGRQRWLVGAPACVPPESLSEEGLDQRADLFSLGTLIYWTLTSRQAFRASSLDDLPAAWREPPRPPSTWIDGLPPALDALVMAMLSIERDARPSGAAEVLARLTVIASLPPEGAEERRRVALSVLALPPFVGRQRQLQRLERHLQEGLAGQGRAVWLAADRGTGRTRIVEEVGVRAQLIGATALRVDASAHVGHQATVRALALRLLDTLPDVARACASHHLAALTALGTSVDARLRGVLPPAEAREAAAPRPLWPWFVAVSRQRPLLIAVDNAERCDDTSILVLLELARSLRGTSLVLLLVEPPARASTSVRESLRALCERESLSNLELHELRELAQSLFGETPHVERFAHWLHQCTGGNPLHALAVVRALLARDVVRYESGYWVLPVRPAELAVAPPDALEVMLAQRIASLSPGARSLAQALSLLCIEPTPAVCREVVRSFALGRAEEGRAEQLLAELTQQAVLVREPGGYGFSSSALRAVTVLGMDELETRPHHLALGRALVALGAQDEANRVAAGWHLMLGGDELGGANLVAAAMSKELHLERFGSADIGAASERALLVYQRYRRSAYARLPLLGALAHAVFADNYAFYERYADTALDVFDDVSGMRSARNLRRWLGGPLALGLALLVAALRFRLAAKRDRPYSFPSLLRQMGNCVAMLTGIAALGLDADRSERIADVLEPFSFLPQAATSRGLLMLCRGFELLGREQPVEAQAAFALLIDRFRDDRWYRLLPARERALCLAAATYARAGISVLRADGSISLADADALETCGLQPYVAVSPYLRYAYYAQRGEQALALPFRGQLERHAARAGAAWQAELWMAAALVPVSLTVGDLMALTHLNHRLHELARLAPAISFYARLSTLALRLARDDLSERDLATAIETVEACPPRSFIGWSVLVAMTARVRNRQGRHRDARALCARASAHMSDADYDFVGLFLQVDLEGAVADAGLGDTQAALLRLDGLLRRFETSGHLLALGLLHETRALVALRAGLQSTYEESLPQVERLFRATGTPTLIARAQRLAAIGRPGEARTIDEALPDVHGTISPLPTEANADTTIAEPHRRAHDEER